MHGMRWDRREADEFFRDETRRYPEDLALDRGATGRLKLRRQRRTGRSVNLTRCEMALKLSRKRTKIRIPSASAFQRSAVLSSSSAAIFEYRENTGPELSL